MKTNKQALRQLFNIPRLLILSAILIIAACSKSNNGTTVTPTGYANVAVINVSPTSSMYSVYSDTSNIYSGNTISYGGATGVNGGSPYEVVTSGSHAIKLSSNGTTYPLDTTLNLNANSYYSVFAYDTAVGSGNLKTLVLNDNLSVPANGNAEVRFVNLSPNSSALNVWLINADTTMKDTTALNNISYVGSSTINTDSLSAFKTITPGTYNVYFNSANTLQNLFTTNSTNTVTFTSGKIYTIYSKGYINGVNGTDSLGLGVIQNY